MQFGIHIEIIFLGFLRRKKSGQFFLIKPGQPQVVAHFLQCLQLHTEHIFIPTGIQRHAVVGENIGFLLGFGKVVNKDTRHFRDILLSGSGDSTVSGNDIKIPVDDDRVHKAKLPNGSA